MKWGASVHTEAATGMSAAVVSQLLIWSSCFSVSKLDNVIEHVLSQKLLHQFDPKLWYKFITAFLENNLFRELLECYVSKLLLRVYFASDHFLQIASVRILKPGLREQFDKTQTKTTKQVLVSFSPTGWIKEVHNYFSTQYACGKKGHNTHYLNGGFC